MLTTRDTSSRRAQAVRNADLPRHASEIWASSTEPSRCSTDSPAIRFVCLAFDRTSCLSIRPLGPWRQRQGNHDALREQILQREQVAERALKSRPDDRPPGASTSYADSNLVASPQQIAVMTMSASASAAMRLRSGTSPANCAAVTLDRTTSDSSPDNEPVMASGHPNARKSVSGSERRIRNGRTIRRVIDRARTGFPESATRRIVRRSCAMASAVP